MTSIEVYHAIIKQELKPKELVTILELININLDIDTISEMARKENKSPNGIKVSKRYKKIRIGKQLMAVKI